MTVSETAADTSTRSDERRERLGAAAVYAIGAVAYFIAREVLEMDFLLSPLFYGLIVLAASYVRPRLLAPAIVLICWGTAVVLDGRGPIEDGRTAQMHTFGFGLGALVLWLLRARIDPAASLQTLATIMLVVGVWYYFVYEIPELEEPWLWSAVFLATAAALVAGVLLASRTRETGEGGSMPHTPVVLGGDRQASLGVSILIGGTIALGIVAVIVLSGFWLYPAGWVLCEGGVKVSEIEQVDGDVRIVCDDFNALRRLFR